uniref:Uncharacterized protein n=1 Tax=Romanomermis culicivorax TaxID=13658 RepID=A0A915I8Q6_ROMCU
MWKAKPKLRFGVYVSNMKSTNEQSADFVKGYDNPENNLYLMQFQRSSSLNKQIQPIPLSYEKVLVGSSLEWLAYGWNLKCKF